MTWGGGLISLEETRRSFRFLFFLYAIIMDGWNCPSSASLMLFTISLALCPMSKDCLLYVKMRGRGALFLWLIASISLFIPFGSNVSNTKIQKDSCILLIGFWISVNLFWCIAIAWKSSIVQVWELKWAATAVSLFNLMSEIWPFIRLLYIVYNYHLLCRHIAKI